MGIPELKIVLYEHASPNWVAYSFKYHARNLIEQHKQFWLPL